MGIGTIRDQIADVLFPGTSTLITRAKYYLLVPCIIREATDGSHGWNVREVLKWIDDQERESAEKMIRRHAGMRAPRASSAIRRSVISGG